MPQLDTEDFSQIPDTFSLQLIHRGKRVEEGHSVFHVVGSDTEFLSCKDLQAVDQIFVCKRENFAVKKKRPCRFVCRGSFVRDCCRGFIVAAVEAVDGRAHDISWEVLNFVESIRAFLMWCARVDDTGLQGSSYLEGASAGCLQNRRLDAEDELVNFYGRALTSNFVVAVLFVFPSACTVLGWSGRLPRREQQILTWQATPRNRRAEALQLSSAMLCSWRSGSSRLA